MAMDMVDFEIKGAEMQFVEVELDPGEAAIGEAGSMMFMDVGIGMDTVFGDGSAQQGGIFGKLIGAGKRLVTGESLFTTVYTNQVNTRQRVAFAAPYPGKILPMDLSRLGGTLICQKDAFLCAARGVSLGIAFQRKLSVGFFGGEGFIMQRLDGDGLAFAHAGGRQGQDRAVRRRRPVLRQAHRPRHHLAAKPAVLAPGFACVCRCAAAGRLARGRVGAGRVRGGRAAGVGAGRRRGVARLNRQAASSKKANPSTTSNAVEGLRRSLLQWRC